MVGVRSFCFVLVQINQHLLTIYRGTSPPPPLPSPHVFQARYRWWQAGDPRSRRRLGKRRDARTGQRQSLQHPPEMEREASRRARGTAPALPCPAIPPLSLPRGPLLLFQMHIAVRNNMRNIISVPWEKLASQILNQASSICQGDCFDLIHTKSSIIEFKVCEHVSDQYTMHI